MKSSISAGLVIYSMLTGSQEIMAAATKVFPVVTDKAECPYICYRCASMEQTPVKGRAGADTITVEVRCYAATYQGSVELAELVRECLDHQQGGIDGLDMRSCYLTGREEVWADDAYLQELQFTVKI
jgi:hypothetical protein